MKICRNTAASMLLPLGLAGALFGCASSGVASSAYEVTVSAVPLDISEIAGSTDVYFVGGWALEGDRAEFGGFSGLMVDGLRLTAVSDRGFWWQQPLAEGARGQIAPAGKGRMGPLFDFGGKISQGLDRRDAEELARWPGGQLLSFEGEHRIVLYRPDRRTSKAGLPPIAGTRPRHLKMPIELDTTFENGGVEAMTRLRDGRLAVFSEQQRDRNDHGLLWVGEPSRGVWRRLKLELADDFEPTSAATLPDGDVLLLERSYEKSRGARARVRRLAREDLSPLPSGERPPIRGVELLRLEPPETVDNFEGIEILPLPDGRVYFLLLSDDNYSDSQRTLLLQFELLGH